MKLAVIGLGLIGGSLALDLYKNRFVKEVWGVENNRAHANQALALNLVDQICPLEEACRQADLVVLAVPVSAIVQLLPQVLTLVSSTAAVTDVGSTKFHICNSIASHPRRKQYVAAHPMAGTEFSGPSAAQDSLFKGKAAVICDPEVSSPACLERVKAMFAALQMRLIVMQSRQHDLHAAYVSHLSHISSFVLANTVLDKEKDAEAVFNLASGGFESTVRLAKSSPDMWAPIFEQNAPFVAEALGDYIEWLSRFRDSIVTQDFTQTRAYMAHANEIRRVLTHINQENPKK